MKQTLIKQELPFTQVPNSLLDDNKISLKAKGLYSFMLSKPDNWNFTTRSMANLLNVGRDSILTALEELKTAKWILYQKHGNGRGTYTILVDPKVGFPHRGKTPPWENSTVGKSHRINNTILNNNTHLNNKKELTPTPEKLEDSIIYPIPSLQNKILEDNQFIQFCAEKSALSTTIIQNLVSTFIDDIKYDPDKNYRKLGTHKAHFKKWLEYNAKKYQNTKVVNGTQTFEA